MGRRGMPPGRVLAFDPGHHHLGWAFFENGEFLTNGESYEPLLANLNWLSVFIPRARPDVIVVEEYRIYPSHLAEHSRSDVPTLRMIGAIQMIGLQLEVPVVLQSAAVGKGFVTDEKLKAWGLGPWKSPHATDATRHGLHYLLFGTYPRS